jgi:hypothetical protein
MRRLLASLLIFALLTTPALSAVTAITYTEAYARSSAAGGGGGASWGDAYTLAECVTWLNLGDPRRCNIAADSGDFTSAVTLTLNNGHDSNGAKVIRGWTSDMSAVVTDIDDVPFVDFNGQGAGFGFSMGFYTILQGIGIENAFAEGASATGTTADVILFDLVWSQNNGGMGLRADDASAVKRSRVNGNGGRGVWLDDDSKIELTEAYDNTGEQLRIGDDGAVNGNTVYETGAGNATTCIQAGASDVSVSWNTVDNCATGIATSTTTPTYLTGNQVTNCTTGSGGGAQTHFHANNFWNNSADLTASVWTAVDLYAADPEYTSASDFSIGNSDQQALELYNRFSIGAWQIEAAVTSGHIIGGGL